MTFLHGKNGILHGKKWKKVEKVPQNAPFLISTIKKEIWTCFTRKNDRKTENVVFLEVLHELMKNRLYDVRNDKCTIQQ